jgi:hypothetical protein
MITSNEGYYDQAFGIHMIMESTKCIVVGRTDCYGLVNQNLIVRWSVSADGAVGYQMCNMTNRLQRSMLNEYLRTGIYRGCTRRLMPLINRRMMQLQGKRAHAWHREEALTWKRRRCVFGRSNTGSGEIIKTVLCKAQLG